jgi:hypothetical protein
MGPSLGQLRLLSPEDRTIYKKWLRRCVMFYSAALALLVIAVAANHIFSPVSEDVRTAAITARK